MTVSSLEMRSARPSFDLLKEEAGRLTLALIAAFAFSVAIYGFGEKMGVTGFAAHALTAFGFIAIGFLLQKFSGVQSGAQSAVDSVEFKRNKQALAGANTNIMLADKNYTITYMNHSMIRMIQAAEADLRAELPQFDARSLIGASIDIFHKNPSHQRRLLDGLRETYKTKIKVGPRSFSLIATPIFDERNERLGTSVEWEDITERLKQEQSVQKIAEENARISLALEGASTNMMLADANNEIIYMNKSMIEMMKIAESDLRTELKDFNVAKLIGANIDGFHKDPSHQRRLLEGLKETYKTRIKVGGRTFSLIANPFFDKENKRLGTSVEWEDLTTRLKAEEAARMIAETNARISLALEGASTNMMLADETNTIVYMNDSMIETMKAAETDLRTELKDFNVAKLIGANIDSFHKNPSHQRRLLEGLNDTYKTRIVVGGRTFSLVANPFFDENKKRLGTSVEWEDLTEELREQEKKFATLSQIEAINKTMSVVEFDMDANYIQANDNFLNLMGYRAGELKGESHGRFVTPAERSSRAYSDIWSSLRRGEDYTGEMQLVGKSGDEVWILASFTVLRDKAGHPYKIVKYATDITARKKAILAISATLGKLSEGDLTAKVTETLVGEFEELRHTLNGTLDSFQEIVGGTIASTSEVSNAATEIASGSADLSQRTEEQASALEETAAAMEQMSSAVKTNADNANQANGLGQSARDIAEEGGAVVNKAVGAMSRIEESSQKISDIIGVIDEIAFQTNLLALNAAVEAARAGDAGKGFAVVASEVRALAQRSSEAAKDIKGLIVDSNQQVKDGVDLVNEAGKQLSEIVASIKRVTDLVSNIASANQEQATGIEEINRAIAEMDEMTQQNSALVEETAASARSLEEQVVAVQGRMAFFRIDELAAAHAGHSIPMRGARAPAKSTPKSSVPKVAPGKPNQGKAAASRTRGGGDDDWAEF